MYGPITLILLAYGSGAIMSELRYLPRRKWQREYKLSFLK